MKLGRPARIRVVTSVSFFTYLAYLLFFIGVGIIMRLNQGANINISATNFYAMMTAHGLGMVATLFSASFVAIWYLLNRYVSMSIRLMWVVYFMNFIGFIGLLSSTLVAKFGAGWYLLYPLPFLDTWPYTSIGLIIYTLIFGG